jgi:hypothetical protein
MSNILLLQDLLDSRKRKADELEFYTEQKKQLETKLTLLRREINLTDTILQMIRKEELIEIARGN